MKRIHSRRSLLHSCNRAVPLLAAAMLASWVGLARGQAFPEISSESENVMQLRRALRLPVGDPTVAAHLAFRERNVGKRIEALRGLGDLGQALVLHEWDLEDQDERVARLNHMLRARIVERFDAAARAMLRRGGARGKEAAARLIGELGAGVRGIGANWGGAMRPLAPDLVPLLRDPDPQVRVAAIDALGKINPDIDVALPPLARELTADSVDARRAAASALGNLVSKASGLAKKQNAGPVLAYRRDLTDVGAGTIPLASNPWTWLLNEGARTTSVDLPSLSRMMTEGPAAASDVVVTRDELLNVELAVIPVAGRGAGDSDAEVRTRSIDALHQAATALEDMIADPRPHSDFPPEGRPPSAREKNFIEEYRFQVDAERTELLPVGRALERQAPVFRRTLAHPQEETRLAARKALVEIGYCRVKLERRVLSVPPFNNAHLPKGEDPVLGLFRAVLPELDAGMSDPYLPVRRATIDALETLGDDAVLALDVLGKALEDRSLFVRWAAARTLGRLAPAEGEKLVPALALQLREPDLDLRLMTAMTLERYGVHARAAIPELRRSIFARDPDMRKAAIAALAGMGPDITADAIPDLIQALHDDTDTVRRAAADALSKYGTAASDAIPALTKMQESDDAEDRRAATNAILEILAPPKK